MTGETIPTMIETLCISLNFLSCSLSHASVLTDQTVNCSVMLDGLSSASARSPVLYRGISHKIDSENVLAVKVSNVFNDVQSFMVY